MAIPKFFKISKITRFIFWKFQLVVIEAHKIRCSMKLVRLHLDLNWESYGNPKFCAKFRKFLPPTENGCGPILWVVLGCNFVDNFLSTIKNFKNCFFPPKKYFFKISKLRFSNF